MATHPNFRQTPPRDEISGVLDWLASPVPDDPASDLAQLCAELGALGHVGLDPARYQRILDLFYDRARRLFQLLRSQLAQASLPLSTQVRAMAALLISANDGIATGYERILGQADRLMPSKRRTPATAAARALRCLGEALQTCYLIAYPLPVGLWRRIHSLAQQSQVRFEPTATVIPGVSLDGEKIYREILALAAIQPEGFTPAEILLAVDYLNHYAAAVNILPDVPDDGETVWYWLDSALDTGPQPSSRRIPPEHGALIRCSFRLLARLLGEQVSALEAGIPAGNLRLPESAAAPGSIAALKRLQAQWARPPQRHFPRRSHFTQAQACVGLDDLWQLLEKGEAPGAGIQTSPPHTTHWQILNESPSGYAVLHVAGAVEGLLPGSVIALRPAEDQPWSICVVRRMKSEGPDHLELGLELLAPDAHSVRILFRNGDAEQQPTAGLLLPALPALREKPAILAPSGAYNARRFFIVSGADKTHVMQGRLLSMEMQTGQVELFQFEEDPYPT